MGMGRADFTSCREVIMDITIRPIEPVVTYIPPHWQPQREARASECVRVVRVPHAPSGFRLLGVILGGRK